MKRFQMFYVTLSIFLISCNANYVINKKKISCYWPKTDNFKISELQVDSIGEKGYPIVFTKKNTVECLTLEYVSKISDSNAEGIKFKPQRRIYFHKENKYYKWCILPCEENTIQNILPLEFKKNHWYEFSGFPENKFLGDNYTIYVYITLTGKLKKFHIYLNPLKDF